MGGTVERFAELMRTGDYQQALDHAMAATELANGAGDALAEAKAHTMWAEAARFLDDNDMALVHGREAERLVSGRSDDEALAAQSDALRVQADALRMVERYEEAMAAAKRAETLARQVGYLKGQADALRPQAWLLLNTDRNEEALEASRLSASISRQAGHEIGEANALDNVAEALLKLEKHEESLEAAQQAVELCHRISDRLREANALQSVANALHELERDDEALQAAIQATDLYQQVGDRLGEGNARRAQADALHKLERDEEALLQAEQARELLREVGSRMGQGSSLRAQAEALHAMGRHREAIERAREAEELFRAIGFRQGQAEALLTVALAAGGLEQNDVAVEAAATARKLFIECGMPGMARYAQYVEESVDGRAPLDAGGKAVARLHEEYGAQLGQILADADKAEEAWHRELRMPRRPPCPPGTGELLILRQWPSYATLSLLPNPDEVAGGYLLRWGDRNLVIDPGLGFLAALRQAGYHLTDIDGVAITHWHIDHTGDVEEMLTSLFEANDPDMVARFDFFLAPGAFSVYANLLAHNPGVRSVTLLRAGEETTWEGGIRLRAILAGHRDLTGRDNNTIGLRIELGDTAESRACTIGITSDTRWLPGLVPALAGCELVVLHLGGIYSRDLSATEYAKNHLGIKGTAELLAAMADSPQPPRMTMVSEIGKELEYERVRLCTILGEVCGCLVFPAELGMQLTLPDLRLKCDSRGCENLATRWGTDPSERRRVCARCDQCTDPLACRDLPH